MKAKFTYWNPATGEEVVQLGDHKLQFGGVGDGYCYGHQSYGCLDKLTDEERRALNFVQ